MRCTSRIASVLVVFVLVLCSAAQGNVYAIQPGLLVRAPAATGGISGVVTAKDTGKPVAGITVVTNINAVLTRRPQVNFVVTTEDTGLPVEGIFIYADPSDGNNFATTDANGRGVVTLNPNIYKFRITPPLGSRHLSEYFDNQISYTQATPINLLQPTTTLTLNVQLQRGGVIVGDIIDHNTGLTANADLYIYDADTNEPIGYGTRSHGSFVSAGLPTGRYKVAVNPVGRCTRGGCIYEPYIRYFYGKALTINEAAVIVVTAPLTTSLGVVAMYYRPFWLPPRLYLPLMMHL